jgi:chemotaxis protein CheD
VTEEPSFEEVLAPNHYFDRHFDIEAAKILPGEYYATSRDMMLVTVLGSSVSVCLRDPAKGIGGLNHFMLPEGDPHDLLSTASRYGCYAMEMLINQLLKLGAARHRLEAKAFGGGEIMRGFVFASDGIRNGDFVRAYLDRERIRLLASDLLDIFPRKVYYFPATGRTLVKKLKQAHNNTIVQREAEYGIRLKSALAGSIELFD